MPISTAGTPHASPRAHIAMPAAAEPVSVRKELPLTPGVKTTFAPNGALDSTWFRTAAMASAGSWPGASRRLNFARARGSSVLEATSTAGASKPMMDSAGLVHSREAMVPLPARRTPSSTDASARYSASVRSTETSSLLTRPFTATFPSSSWRVAIRRESSVGASRTAPPNIPEWTACSRTCTSMVPSTRPRRLVVSAGMPTFQLLESATTMTSARSSSRCVSRNVRNVGDPASSSPSIKNVTPSPSSSASTSVTAA
ncbi:hypothetical protein D9M72_498960 [compost metagenome]